MPERSNSSAERHHLVPGNAALATGGNSSCASNPIGIRERRRAISNTTSIPRRTASGCRGTYSIRPSGKEGRRVHLARRRSEEVRVRLDQRVGSAIPPTRMRTTATSSSMRWTSWSLKLDKRKTSGARKRRRRTTTRRSARRSMCSSIGCTPSPAACARCSFSRHANGSATSTRRRSLRCTSRRCRIAKRPLNPGRRTAACTTCSIDLAPCIPVGGSRSNRIERQAGFFAKALASPCRSTAAGDHAQAARPGRGRSRAGDTGVFQRRVPLATTSTR